MRKFLIHSKMQYVQEDDCSPNASPRVHELENMIESIV